ncbi:hypothetical protein GIB67_042234 [Kingdonia uniflora]|uniref:Histone deacetylase domain-containing protein n=1 Tax=Kingdonia uniflora TaxID=39325 RepID=A0A7J7LDR0_9MAGN|nr:hypothetical protein GIB67_042234 [Kingdonia uniflora]
MQDDVYTSRVTRGEDASSPDAGKESSAHEPLSNCEDTRAFDKDEKRKLPTTSRHPHGVIISHSKLRKIHRNVVDSNVALFQQSLRRIECVNTIALTLIILVSSRGCDHDMQLVHSLDHLNLIKSLSSKSVEEKKVIVKKWAKKSVYFYEESSDSACLAVDYVIKVKEKVFKGELDSAVAIVQPPGHHAEADKAIIFCLYNNIVIAASHIKKELKVSKIMIVDWDIHHGNGTQKSYWKDNTVLYFSVHRYDSGKFFPGGDVGSHNSIGEGEGKGFTINVPWPHGLYGDADYLVVWEHILLPVAHKFNSDIILISGGFDAGKNLIF